MQNKKHFCKLNSPRNKIASRTIMFISKSDVDPKLFISRATLSPKEKDVRMQIKNETRQNLPLNYSRSPKPASKLLLTHNCLKTTPLKILKLCLNYFCTLKPAS